MKLETIWEKLRGLDDKGVRTRFNQKLFPNEDAIS
jgi:hypothetical protein